MAVGTCSSVHGDPWEAVTGLRAVPPRARERGCASHPGPPEGAISQIPPAFQGGVRRTSARTVLARETDANSHYDHPATLRLRRRHPRSHRAQGTQESPKTGHTSVFCRHPISLSNCREPGVGGGSGSRQWQRVCGQGLHPISDLDPAGHPSLQTGPRGRPARGCAPFFLARAMMSAALLLMTLVMYTGQLIRPAMVMARNTASASSWGHSRSTVTGGVEGSRRPPREPGALPAQSPPTLLTCGQRKTYCLKGGKD